MSGRRITVHDAGKFSLAGDAIFTLVRPERVVVLDGVETFDEEKRFTYRIQRAKVREGDDPDPQRPWFVKVLSGPNNLSDYQYLGTIFPTKFGGGVVYRHGKKSRVSEDAPSVRGIAWFVKHLSALLVLRGELDAAGLFDRPEIEADIAKVEGTLNKLHYWHEGRCGMCARRLTVPESIINGLGPICVTKLGAPGILERLAKL